MIIRIHQIVFLFSLLSVMTLIHAEESSYGISGNPGAVNILTGTGELGNLLQIPKRSGVRLGGLWMGDYNALLHGGNGTHHNRRWTGNSLLILDLFIDLQKAIGWKSASFGTEFLQFNGQPTNADAGVVQGYNSLPGAPPLNRSELYQLWIRQEFLNNKLSIRLGKTVPTYHFNNVSKPVPTENSALAIPSVSGLIYTPIFVNTTLLGVIGGYYNSVYGIIATIAPVKQAYVNIGVYDGNLARGVQTGLTGPHFNGYYFSIVEGGYGWTTPKPGIAAIGGWYQSGLLTSETQKEHGTEGIYAFGSQALWIEDPLTANKGNVSGFFQLGWNNSKTLPMNLFAGMGLTAFALVPNRPNDSFGMGVSWSRLNSHTFSRYSEWMFQGYYQAQVYKSIYFQPVLSYIPNPGAHPTKSNVLALTGRLTVLF
jgi:porin